MDKRVAALKNPEDCLRFIKNALNAGREDLVQQARQRRVILLAEATDAKNEAERDAYAVLYAYEETLLQKHGKKMRATYTRRMIKELGILPAVERAVNKPTETVGYKALQEMGLQSFSFEAVVLKYPELFSKEATARCLERINNSAHLIR